MFTRSCSKKHILLFASSALLALILSGQSIAALSQHMVDAPAIEGTTIPLVIDKQGMINTISYLDNNQNQQQVRVSVSEQNGIALKNSQEKLWQRAGNFTHADTHISHQGKDDTLVITFFDNNTQEVVALRLVPSTFEVVSEISIPMPGSEAICASITASGGTEPGNTELVNIDANGELHHLLVTDEKFIPLRKFAIGPGIKSCAIQSQNKTLYLADEFAGVWKMNIDMENELSRELIFHHSDYAIEGVSVLSSASSIDEGGALIGWVSPDNSGIWLKNQCDYYNIDLVYNNGDRRASIKPETVWLSQKRFEDPKDSTKAPILTIRVDDDDSDNIFVAHVPMTRLSHHCTAPNSTSTMLETMPTDVTSVTADAETQPVAHAGDAADDPAVWVNSTSPDHSLVIGTDKKGALNSYNLNGALVQSLPVGRVNNVDVGYAVNIPSRTLKRGDTIINSGIRDIAVASNRTNNSLSVLSISREGALTHEGDVNTTLNDIYGMCLFVDQGVAQVLANDTSGRYEQYTLSFNDDNHVSGALIYSFSLPSQPEGCVIDGNRKVAYLGEEGAGIWALDLSTQRNQPVFLMPISAPVEADIEGLALFSVDNVQYLIASSQGNNAYAIYRTSYAESPKLEYVGLIQIEANFDAEIDGVSETDGIEAINANLGGVFSEGLWVVQDGRNVMPSEAQNFKLVSGKKLSTAIRALLQK